MRMDNISYSGKTALITGGARGIGFATAEQIVALGGRVVVVDINAEAGAAAAEKLGNAAFYQVDLADDAAVRSVFAAIIAAEGHVDVLFNIAAIVNTPSFAEITKAQWDQIINLDLTSVYVTSQILFNHMAELGGGRIVNLASIAGKVGGGYLGTSAYAAAKAGVISLTKAIAKEGAPLNIYCNSLCPAYTDTPLVKDALVGEKREKVLAAMKIHRPARAEEVANGLVFIGSDAASFITGENLNCDGGMLMDG